MGVGGFFFLRCETLGQVPSAPRPRSVSQRGGCEEEHSQVVLETTFPHQTEERSGAMHAIWGEHSCRGICPCKGPEVECPGDSKSSKEDSVAGGEGVGGRVEDDFRAFQAAVESGSL